MNKISYKTHGICARQINVEVEDGIVKNVQFVGGCNGNTSGISKLVEGMKVEDVIERLQNVDCNGKGTSCPAQLAEALRLAKH
ncbi:MAG: TIGR03905 family TSCPD domain-containing protein [Oscillospiraceae bacterium]